MIEMLYIIVFLLIELKAFSGSTKIKSSTSYSCYKSYIAWMLFFLSNLVLSKLVPQLAEHLSLLCSLRFPMPFDAIHHPHLLDKVLEFYLMELIKLPWTPLNYFQNHHLLYMCLWCNFLHQTLMEHIHLLFLQLLSLPILHLYIINYAMDLFYWTS